MAECGDVRGREKLVCLRLPMASFGRRRRYAKMFYYREAEVPPLPVAHFSYGGEMGLFAYIPCTIFHLLTNHFLIQIAYHFSDQFIMNSQSCIVFVYLYTYIGHGNADLYIHRGVYARDWNKIMDAPRLVQVRNGAVWITHKPFARLFNYKTLIYLLSLPRKIFGRRDMMSNLRRSTGTR